MGTGGFCGIYHTFLDRKAVTIAKSSKGIAGASCVPV